jgi:hypothetical protein
MQLREENREYIIIVATGMMRKSTMEKKKRLGKVMTTNLILSSPVISSLISFFPFRSIHLYPSFYIVHDCILSMVVHWTRCSFVRTKFHPRSLRHRIDFTRLSWYRGGTVDIHGEYRRIAQLFANIIRLRTEVFVKREINKYKKHYRC